MSRDRNQSRVFFGAFIIIVGALALLNNLHIFDTSDILPFWPLVFVGFGVMKLYQARHTSAYVLGGVLVLVGCGMILQRLGIMYFRWRDWWPAFVIFAGAMVLSRGLYGKQWRSRRDGVELVDGDNSSVDVVAVMSGHNLKSDSQTFKGGDILAVMGGVELDLRQASIVSEATLSVFAMWGGIVIKVPNDWSVVMNGTPILGGMDDKTVPPLVAGKRLVIVGEAIMGGVEVKN
ncbi:LiaI-LiaF-like domain-containing protein [Undibacterium sp. TJN25]|uniref:LiaI-LiaF-like domain-containing protein n=1 Tax=Undibacterium sp. TJN25 TaxID=3413056 RepID=UPI003BF193FF